MKINLTEGTRRTIGLILLIFHTFMLLSSLITSLLCWKKQVDYNQKANLFTKIDAIPLGILSCSTGYIGIILHSSGAVISYLFSHSSSRVICQRFFGPWLAIFSLVFLFDAIVLILYFFHQTALYNAMENGILPAMRKYTSSIDIKAALDLVQYELECCGNNGFEDWMGIRWVPKKILEERIRKNSSEKSLATEWIPESCCNLNFEGPCYPHVIFKKRKGIEIDDVFQMFYLKGCKNLLYKHLKELSEKYKLYFMFFVVIQVPIIILSRYLHTSGTVASESANKTSSAIGWMIFAADSKEKFKRELGAKRIEETPSLGELKRKRELAIQRHRVKKGDKMIVTPGYVQSTIKRWDDMKYRTKMSEQKEDENKEEEGYKTVGYVFEQGRGDTLYITSFTNKQSKILKTKCQNDTKRIVDKEMNINVTKKTGKNIRKDSVYDERAKQAKTNRDLMVKQWKEYKNVTKKDVDTHKRENHKKYRD